MSGAPQPRMHGSTHVPSGSDPIPGLCEECLPASGSFAGRVLAVSSLVGYWPMNDASGNAHDESGHSRPLSPVGTPTYSDPGPFADASDTSILMSGTDSTGTPADDSFHGSYSALNLDGGDMTVMFFIYPTAYPSLTGGITFYGSPSGGAGVAHMTQIRSDGRIFWSVGATQQAQTASPYVVPLTTWTFVACTRDSTALNIYFNGVLAATHATEAVENTASDEFRFGCLMTAANDVYYYKGRLAQVALFNAALTQAEIVAIYGGGVSTDAEPGDVLTIDGSGNPTWTPPTTVATDTIWDAKGDIAAASAADTAARLPVGSNGQVLTADSAQTLGVKWATPSAGAGVAGDSIWDTKGDLAVASGADAAAKLPVGSNGQVLTADSTQTLGVKWAAAGGGGAWTLLSSTTLSSDGVFDVSSISGSYNDLICVLIARSTEAGSAETNARFQFNGDNSLFGTNYNRQEMHGVSGTTVAASETNSGNGIFAGRLPQASALANSFGVLELIIFGYASTTWLKACIWNDYNARANSSSSQEVFRGGGWWNNTAAITRIQVDANGNNCKSGSQLRIYGRL